MLDTYEHSSIAFVEGCIGNATEHINRALNCSGLLGLENDDWAETYLNICKAQKALERAKVRVLSVRSRRLESRTAKGFDHA